MFLLGDSLHPCYDHSPTFSFPESATSPLAGRLTGTLCQLNTDYVMHIKFKCRQSGSLTNTVQLNTLLFKNFRTWLLDLASALPLAKAPLKKSS